MNGANLLDSAIIKYVHSK